MNRYYMVFIAFFIPFSVFAKNDLTGNFIKEVKMSADSEKDISTSIGISCPADSGSGRLLIKQASYDFGKTNGVFVFKDQTINPVKISLIETIFENGDFASGAVIGFSFTMTMPNGQFFIDLTKGNNVKAGVIKNGESDIKWIKCKIVIPS